MVTKGENVGWRGYQLLLYNNKIAAEIMDGSTLVGVGNGLVGTTTLNDGFWHHVAMVVTRSTGNAKLYVDGKQEASVSSGIVSSNLDNSSSMYIATELTASLRYAGKMDELRIWAAARTQSQIAANMYYNVNPSSTGLRFYYSFDNYSASPLADLTSNNNAGYIQGGVTVYASTANIAAADPGSALNFVGGSSSYIQTIYKAATDLSTGGALTIEAWVNTSADGNIIMKGNYGYGLMIASGKLLFWDQSSQASAVISNNTLTFGKWNHVAVTVQDAGSTLSVNLYINGVPDAGNPFTSNQISINNGGASQPLYIGRQGAGCACNYFSGNMDELRIWNAVRTASEIQNFKDSALTPSAYSNLVAYYKFDEGIAGGNNTNGGCDSISATGVISVLPRPSAPIAVHKAICGSGTTQLSATCGASQTIDWYDASTGGSALQTGSLTYNTSFISTTTSFYALARDTASSCVSVNRTQVIASVYITLSGIANSTTTGISNQCDNGTWKSYFDVSNPGNLIVQIKDNGNDLGVVTVSTYIDSSVNSYQGICYLQRHFKITPTNQPTSSVRVRLFFSNAEYTALKAKDQHIQSVNNIGFTKYQGPTEDSVFNSGDATSITFINSSSITFDTLYNARYAEFSINGFSEFWGSMDRGGSVLPIELNLFDVKKVGKQAEIVWETSKEKNSKQFDILRSNSLNDFEVIGTVDASGNSQRLIQYQFIDNFPLPGMNYYKLRQTDMDGSVSFSDIKAITFEQVIASNIQVYPVPASDLVNIQITEGNDVLKSAILYSIDGKQLKSFNFEQGASKAAMNIKDLSNGFYFLEVLTGSGVQRIKIELLK